MRTRTLVSRTGRTLPVEQDGRALPALPEGAQEDSRDIEQPEPVHAAASFLVSVRVEVLTNLRRVAVLRAHGRIRTDVYGFADRRLKPTWLRAPGSKCEVGEGTRTLNASKANSHVASYKHSHQPCGRTMREEGVEPSSQVWKTCMLAVTTLPRKSERAVQDSNPHLEPFEAARFFVPLS